MICLNKDDKNIIPLFLSLPQLLYKGDNPQSKKTEKQILTYPDMVKAIGIPDIANEKFVVNCICGSDLNVAGIC